MVSFGNFCITYLEDYLEEIPQRLINYIQQITFSFDNFNIRGNWPII